MPFIVVPALFIWSRIEDRSPFDDIEFVEDYPGAGERFGLFTPVLRSDPAITVGEPAGADFGKLHFRDCDGDGVNEAVVETEGNYSGEFSEAVRHVYKYAKDASGLPQAKLISTEYMPEKDAEWVRGKFKFTGQRYCEK